MIFWICLAMFIGGIVWCAYSQWDNGYAIVTMSVGLGLSIICIVVLLCTNLGVMGFIAENQVKYETLAYQYENDIYDNDNDLGKRELMVDIQEWNEDLAWHQANQDDFWIGIFIPNVFDQFEFIQLDGNSSSQ